LKRDKNFVKTDTSHELVFRKIHVLKLTHSQNNIHVYVIIYAIIYEVYEQLPFVHAR